MNEAFVAQQIMCPVAFAFPAETLCNITILNDVEVLSRQPKRVADLQAQLSALCGQASHFILLESAFPEIRLVATLLAGMRFARSTRSRSVHWSDAADWLAARILLLDLSHVVLTTVTFHLLDNANERLAQFANKTGIGVPQAKPMLHLGQTAVCNNSALLLRCFSCLPYTFDKPQRDVTSVLDTNQQLRELSRQRYEVWLGELI